MQVVQIIKIKNNKNGFIKEIQQHGGGVEQEEDDALGEEDVLEIEEHRPEDIKKRVNNTC